MEAMESFDIENTSMEIKSARNIIVEHSITENTSTSKFANYDVFISHRGPDTKTGFVGYLYEALKARGLVTFLDCESIEMGEDAWRSIENAIKNSKIAVVVFSENFASSPWCLKELDAILDTPGMEVRIIFYKVRPSEVKYPESGRLKKGFEKLSARYERAVIERWKKRLFDASQRMGWEIPCDSKRLEVEFVLEIVKDILASANKPLPLNVCDFAAGVERIAKELVQILENEKEVLMLGLWGMGGIGKSTLARELYNKMRPRYDSSCYIEDVSEVVYRGGVKTIQQQIMKDLCKNDPNDIDGKSKGRTILKERLSNIRFLLVLDDIQDYTVMEHCIVREMFRKGSMCIVTSRDKSILKISPSLECGFVEREVYIHHVQGLNVTNSKEVLKFHAFGGCSSTNLDDELVSSISKGCGGVPLVLKVIGAFLRGKEVKIWNEMVEKLSVSAIMDDKKLFECLRISYDGLSRECQDMFLDIACALIEERKDYAVRIWKFGEERIQNLVEKALITVGENGCLKMHDHLRDMGREVERRNMERRRMWMPEALELLQREHLPLSLQTLNLSFGSTDRDANKDHMMKLDVSQMRDLRIFVCDELVKISSNLPNSTHWFRLTGRKYPFAKVNIPTIQEYSELKILVLKDVEVYGFLRSVRKLRKLEVLDLERCQKLQLCSRGIWNSLDMGLPCLGIRSFTNTLEELSNLEVLNLDYCPNLTILPDSFGGLKKLHKLRITFSVLPRLPNTFTELGNLEVLELVYCRNLTLLPDSFGDLKKLHKFTIVISGITRLPNTFGELSNLEVLGLYRCGNLTKLPDSFGGLKKLHKLYIDDVQITRLPKTFGELSNLEVLECSCGNLTILPCSFGSLKNLRDLNLCSSGITRLPDTFGELSNLEVLNLSYCPLTTLPHSFGGLKKLRDLNLCSSGITRLPDTFGELSNLEVLDLRHCSDLTTLRDSFGDLTKLRDLLL